MLYWTLKSIILEGIMKHTDAEKTSRLQEAIAVEKIPKDDIQSREENLAEALKLVKSIRETLTNNENK